MQFTFFFSKCVNPLNKNYMTNISNSPFTKTLPSEIVFIFTKGTFICSSSIFRRMSNFFQSCLLKVNCITIYHDVILLWSAALHFRSDDNKPCQLISIFTQNYLLCSVSLVIEKLEIIKYWVVLLYCDVRHSTAHSLRILFFMLMLWAKYNVFVNKFLMPQTWSYHL